MNTAGIHYNSNNKNYFIFSKKKFMEKSILLSLLIHWIYVVQGKQLVSFTSQLNVMYVTIQRTKKKVRRIFSFSVLLRVAVWLWLDANILRLLGFFEEIGFSCCTRFRGDRVLIHAFFTCISYSILVKQITQLFFIILKV